MEHFSVIQSLCRVGLTGEPGAFAQQVERLVQRLAKAGDEKSASSLRRLLEAPRRATELAPSRVELSRSTGGGEALSRNVRPHMTARRARLWRTLSLSQAQCQTT